MTGSESSRPASEVHLERLRRYQDILRDFSRMSQESTDLGRLLQLTCVQAARGTGIGHTKVMRYRRAEGDLLVEAGIGWRPGVVGQARLGTDVASPSGRALQSRQPVMSEDIQNDPELRNPPVLREHGIVSLLNAPVVVDGTVWGVLEVDSEQGRHFSDDDVTFLVTMGTILGNAIHRHLGAREGTEAAAQAARILAEQRTLMRELLHRDKNDFQLVISLLMMQRRKQQDPEAKRGFSHVIDRVTAISMAHDQLSMREGSIDLGEYLRALCGSLNQRHEGVRVEAEVDFAVVAHERVVPLGLIVNELATNALKYAFPDGRSGTVRVTFRVKPENGEAFLRVADDGVGMQGKPREGSSGLELVRALARQVGGQITQDTGAAGTAFQVDFLVVR